MFHEKMEDEKAEKEEERIQLAKDIESGKKIPKELLEKPIVSTEYKEEPELVEYDG